MQIENMNETDVAKVSDLLEKLKESNPALTSKVYSMAEPDYEAGSFVDLSKKLDALILDVEALKNRIDFVFGGYVLIDGRFEKIS
jgi:hypothetical protein